MNKIYRNVWNAVTGTYVAAAETVRGTRKGPSGRVGKLAALAVAVSFAVAVLPGIVHAQGTAVGPNAEALGADSVAVGSGAKAHRKDGVAVGAGAESMGNGGVAVGAGAKAHGEDSAAVGAGAAATMKNSLAVGKNARAEREGSVALGHLAAVTGNDSIAIGSRANAQRDNSLALGNDASVLFGNSVALGASSIANGNTLNQQAYLVGGTAKGEVSVGSAGNERRITNLAAGSQDTDAVNVAQLNKGLASAGGSTDAVKYDQPEHSSVTLGSTKATRPVAVTNVAAGAVSSGSTDAVNGGQLFDMRTRVDGNTTSITNLQSSVSSITSGGIKYFHASDGGGYVLNEPVSDSIAAGAGSIAVGPGASANGLASSALGWKANASGTGSVAVGTGATGDRPNGAEGGWSTAIGSNAYAQRDRAIALGADARALGESSVALGVNAETTHTGSAAIGANSIANGNTLNQQAYLVGGTAKGEMSVGSARNERRITNLAAGSQDTDAVNLAQLKAVDSGIRGNAVMYSDETKKGVTFAGNGGTQLKNVANGTDADDAVNVSQLSSVQRDALNWNQSAGAYDASHGVAGATNRIAHVSAGEAADDAVNVGQLNALGSGIRDGAVMYDMSENGLPDYGRVTLRGQGGTALDNVAPGEISSNSMFAVNGSQLHSMASSMGQSLGGGSGVDQSGNWRAPSYNVGNNTFHNVGDALANIDGRVTNVEGSVTAISQQINNGEVGLVKQDTATGTVTVGADRNGTAVNVSGTDGSRKVTGVADGDISANSTDAVNGGQIYALNQQMGSVNYSMESHAQSIQDTAVQAKAYTDQRVGAALQSANGYTDRRVETLRRDASGGTAAAMAMAGLPQSVQYGRSLVGVSGATYDGQSAVALGLSRVSPSGRWVFKGTASTNTRGTYGVAVGAGMHW